MSILCHFLIGTPASGKSTFAKNLKTVTNAEIVSTDRIRKELYGDESKQGNWLKIEATVIARIKAAVAEGKSVIYDATNAKRAWRMSMLMKLKDIDAEWIGWWIKTDSGICQKWNKKRERQVPNWVIETYYDNLKKFPPQIAEGFVAINEIKDINRHDYKNKKYLDIHKTNIKEKIDALPASKRNQANRVQNYTLHEYSHLLDFDRLLHLISLMLRYPGIGNLSPETLKEIFNQGKPKEKRLVEPPVFESSLDEISAIMAYCYGEIYSDRLKLESDLIWLEENKLLDFDSSFETLKVNIIEDVRVNCHTYSDLNTFKRLIYTIRFISQNPLILNKQKGSLRTLLEELCQIEDFYDMLINKHQSQSPIDDEKWHQEKITILRKDIQNILKPHNILLDKPMRKGYYTGLAIFNQTELENLFNKIIVPNLEHLEDPIYLDLYQKIKNKISDNKVINSSVQTYPIRAIKNTSIVDNEKLIKSSRQPLIYKNIGKLEKAIANRQLIKIGKLGGTAVFPTSTKVHTLVYPLQLVYYQIAWYLGYEIAEGDDKGLLKFERLDRLTWERKCDDFRSEKKQQQSLKNLIKLYSATPSLFIGATVKDQKRFLKDDKDILMTIELWFVDNIFDFIAEGTKRYPTKQLKMSLPKGRENFCKDNFKSIFTLARSKDDKFPNRLRLTLPEWSISDVNLKSWILGFDKAVKVIEPQDLVDKIKACGSGIVDNYK